MMVLLITACKKNECIKNVKPKLIDGIITGVDMRECVCCGGLMITFSNDPKPYSATFNTINKMPENTGINEQSKFPIYVSVKYTNSPNNCGNSVDISYLEKR